MTQENWKKVRGWRQMRWRESGFLLNPTGVELYAVVSISFFPLYYSHFSTLDRSYI